MEAEQVSHLQKAGVPTTDDLPKYEWYQTLDSEIVAIYQNKEFPTEITPESGVVGIMLKNTSFYAESGGQIADNGVITVNDFTYCFYLILIL